jgi:hypothetical protein
MTRYFLRIGDQVWEVALPIWRPSSAKTGRPSRRAVAGSDGGRLKLS